MLSGHSIVAYYALHYGKEWLHWSMRSIRPYVDEIVVLYVPEPSHGGSTKLQCPDTRDSLKRISNFFGAHWFEGIFPEEGQHRNTAIDICLRLGADITLVVDADEVWDGDVLQASLQSAIDSDCRNTLVPMRHFWRSVHWVCNDQARPVRILNMKHRASNLNVNYTDHTLVVNHFGYAQSLSTIVYKMGIHGHRAEWRPEWFPTKFLPWRPGSGIDDVHPTNENFWTPEAFDASQIEHLVGDHPYFSSELIR